MENLKKNQLNSVVTHILQVSPMMKIFRIAPHNWDLPDFKSGQYATIGLPASNCKCPDSEPDIANYDENEIISRPYSIASSSKSKEYIEFYITLVKSGAFTPRLFNLNIGDPIHLGDTCSGIFTLDQVPLDSNIVFVATGTGISPYISMLRSDALKSKRKIAVIHGAANSWDLGYFSELKLIESVSKRFLYIPTIVNPDKEFVPWKGNTSYVQNIWIDKQIENAWGEKLTPQNTHIFLCGNPRMVETMVDLLETEGYNEHSEKKQGQIHVERW